MLDRVYFTKGIMKLCNFYDIKTWTTNQVEAWYEFFHEYTPEQFKYAVHETIKTEVFFPKVATLIKKIEELKKTPEDMAREFESLLFKYDTDQTLRLFKSKNDKIAVNVVENNYKNLRECMNSDKNILKAQMRNQYLAKINNLNKEVIISENNLLIKDSFKELIEMKKIGD